jgi:sulfopyruvate decarboxylase TPP-binding subunit
MLNGKAILDAIHASGINIVTALPDVSTSAGLLFPVTSDPRFRLIRLCKEDEGVGICAGLALAGVRSMLMMQHTGLLDSINAIRGVPVENRLPVVMLVGLLHKEPERRPEDASMYGVRIVPGILAAMDVDALLLDSDADTAAIPAAIDKAYRERRPLVMMTGRSPAAP